MIRQNRYSEKVLKHLPETLSHNAAVMESLQKRLVQDVQAGRSLLVAGSGHSGLFALELFHRAGGASFVLPLIEETLLPIQPPAKTRAKERTPGAFDAALKKAAPVAGEMIWIASQSGINSATVDLALKAKEQGLHVVAFTSVTHSRSVQSRHTSGLRLFEVAHEVMDLCGVAGDACVEIRAGVSQDPCRI